MKWFFLCLFAATALAVNSSISIQAGQVAHVDLHVSANSEKWIGLYGYANPQGEAIFDSSFPILPKLGQQPQNNVSAAVLVQKSASVFIKTIHYAPACPTFQDGVFFARNGINIHWDRLVPATIHDINEFAGILDGSAEDAIRFFDKIGPYFIQAYEIKGVHFAVAQTQNGTKFHTYALKDSSTGNLIFAVPIFFPARLGFNDIMVNYQAILPRGPTYVAYRTPFFCKPTSGGGTAAAKPGETANPNTVGLPKSPDGPKPILKPKENTAQKLGDVLGKKLGENFIEKLFKPPENKPLNPIIQKDLGDTAFKQVYGQKITAKEIENIFVEDATFTQAEAELSIENEIVISTTESEESQAIEGIVNDATEKGDATTETDATVKSDATEKSDTTANTISTAKSVVTANSGTGFTRISTIHSFEETGEQELSVTYPVPKSDFDSGLAKAAINKVDSETSDGITTEKKDVLLFETQSLKKFSLTSKGNTTTFTWVLDVETGDVYQTKLAVKKEIPVQEIKQTKVEAKTFVAAITTPTQTPTPLSTLEPATIEVEVVQSVKPLLVYGLAAAIAVLALLGYVVWRKPWVLRYAIRGRLDYVLHYFVHKRIKRSR